MESNYNNEEIKEIKKKLEEQQKAIDRQNELIEYFKYSINEVKDLKGIYFTFEFGATCIFGADVSKGIISQTSRDGVNSVKKSIQNL